jgi:Iron/zinc purple acid phosphatase-like protein C
MMEALEQLFLKHGVNLVFSGHNHAYVRTHSLQQVNGTTETGVDVTGRSPMYFTVGTGGDSHSRGPIHETPESWVASRDHTLFGAGKLYLQNNTHAKWERLLLPDDLKNKDSKRIEELRDATWIVNHHCAEERLKY